MSTESVAVVDLVRSLNTCVQVCIDGQKGYALGSANVRDPKLKDMLMRHANERSEFVKELQVAIEREGRYPENEGTVRGAAHRAWVAAERVLDGRSDKLMLEECAAGERAGIRDYEVALRRASLEALAPPLRDMLRRQYDSMKAALAEVVASVPSAH